MPNFKLSFSTELITEADNSEEALKIFAKHIYELATQEDDDKDFDVKIEEQDPLQDFLKIEELPTEQITQTSEAGNLTG